MPENPENKDNLAQPPGLEHGPRPEMPGTGVRIERKSEAERARESEQGVATEHDAHEQPSRSPGQSGQARAAPGIVLKSPDVQAVESILEENLKDVFASLTLEQQQEFKREGEVTARRVTSLLQSVKVKVNEITKLIMRWLKRIPGISQYFIEQETKIKTDKLLELRRRGRGE